VKIGWDSLNAFVVPFLSGSWNTMVARKSFLSQFSPLPFKVLLLVKALNIKPVKAGVSAIRTLVLFFAVDCITGLTNLSR